MMTIYNAFWELIWPDMILHNLLMQLDYNREELKARVTANTARFNNAQRGIYDAVMELVNNVEKPSSCTVQVVAERHLFATPLQLLFVLLGKLFFVKDVINEMKAVIINFILRKVMVGIKISKFGQ